MPTIDTETVEQDTEALGSSLEKAYPHIAPRQAGRLSVHSEVSTLSTLEDAVAHAKWTVRSIRQDITDNCRTSAARNLLWLREFLTRNRVPLQVQTKHPPLTLVASGFDAFSAH